VESPSLRKKVLAFLIQHHIQAIFHYVPLHSSVAGKQFSMMCGEDVYTTAESARLIRLPIWYGMEEKTSKYIVEKLYEFYDEV